MLKRFAATVLFAGLTAISGAAVASSTYTYYGSTFTFATPPLSFSDSLVGYVTFSSPLPSNFNSSNTNMLQYSGNFGFSDGITTINFATPTAGNLDWMSLTTDASGNIDWWSFILFSGSNPNDVIAFSSCTPWQFNGSPPTTCQMGSNFGDGVYTLTLLAGTFAFANTDAQGVWISPSPVPEPESYALLLAGLGLLGWVGRRRKNKVA